LAPAKTTIDPLYTQLNQLVCSELKQVKTENIHINLSFLFIKSSKIFFLLHLEIHIAILLSIEVVMKITRIVLGALLFTSLIAHENHEEFFNPQNTVIAFDFHGVVARVSLRGLVWAFFQIPARELIAALPSLPFITRDLIKYSLNNEISEQTLDRLALDYPIVKRLENDVIRMTNQQKPKTYMPELLKMLKSFGYTLVLASNIGQKTLKDLSERANEYMHETLLSFDRFVTPTEENGYHFKPHSPYFIELVSLFPDKKIVFFDDKEINRQAAQQQGIYAFDTSNIIATLQGLHILKSN
jgi:FMN phosphatase YigB (HAD superfamily)